jgi:hypothetical protein
MAVANSKRDFPTKRISTSQHHAFQLIRVSDQLSTIDFEIDKPLLQKAIEGGPIDQIEEYQANVFGYTVIPTNSKERKNRRHFWCHIFQII